MRLPGRYRLIGLDCNAAAFSELPSKISFFWGTVIALGAPPALLINDRTSLATPVVSKSCGSVLWRPLIRSGPTPVFRRQHGLPTARPRLTVSEGRALMTSAAPAATWSAMRRQKGLLGATSCATPRFSPGRL